MNSHHPAQAASDRVASASQERSLWITFRWPLVLAVLSLTGLVGALLADGVWDWLGAGLIAGSVGVVVWARVRAGRG